MPKYSGSHLIRSLSTNTKNEFSAETGFILKRQQDWDDSFRNLYYMLRKNLCNIFYGNLLPTYLCFGILNFILVCIHTEWLLDYLPCGL